MKFAILLLAALPAFSQPVPLVYSTSGADADAISPTVNAFRDMLGPLNAPGPAEHPEGRREINWDGVPAQFTTPNDLPADFFNTTSARGAVLSNPGAPDIRFQVSAAEGAERFDNLMAGYGQLFKTFSGAKLFISLANPAYDVDFRVPGTDRKALVSSFGAVFTNVAVPFTSTVELFGADGKSLGRFAVQLAPRGLSFLGVSFEERVIAKARVTPGNIAAGQIEALADRRNIVAMDDFIFGEPGEIE
ncbi:MAG: hypothetical protein SFV51_06110 [Bryobacteraceae bacterium]|nr:hypothetical protein [Bryobacteraceae bacterium]